MQLVGVEDDLVEGRVTESERFAFLDPRGCGLRTGDVDLVLAGSRDDGGELTEHVFLGQTVDESLVVFLRDEVTAVGIDTFGKNVADLTEVGAERLEDRRLVFRRSATGFLLTAFAVHGLLGDGRADGLAQFVLDFGSALHSLDLFGQFVELYLHGMIGRIVFGREHAVLVALGFEEAVHRLDKGFAVQ